MPPKKPKKRRPVVGECENGRLFKSTPRTMTTRFLFTTKAINAEPLPNLLRFEKEGPLHLLAKTESYAIAVKVIGADFGS